MALDVEEIAVRSGTTADWAASGLVLETGELGLDLDTGELKKGDGATTFDLLVSATPARKLVTLVGGTKVTADTRIRATSVILPVYKTLGTVTATKALTVSRVNGTSFTVTSADGTDTSTLEVLIWY